MTVSVLDSGVGYAVGSGVKTIHVDVTVEASQFVVVTSMWINTVDVVTDGTSSGAIITGYQNATAVVEGPATYFEVTSLSYSGGDWNLAWTLIGGSYAWYVHRAYGSGSGVDGVIPLTPYQDVFTADVGNGYITAVHGGSEDWSAATTPEMTVVANATVAPMFGYDLFSAHAFVVGTGENISGRWTDALAEWWEWVVLLFLDAGGGGSTVRWSVGTLRWAGAAPPLD